MLVAMKPKSVLRSLLDRLVPKRYRLTYEVFVEKVMGRLEEEMLVLPALTSARGAAVDIGANRGYYSYFMCKLFAHVWAFEPNPAVTSAIAYYPHENLTLYDCALSSSPGSLNLYIPIVSGIHYDGWASFDRDNLPVADDFEVRSVAVRTLDEIDIPDVSLIKIDVEGHEMDVLAGARKTIARDRPAIIAEVKNQSREAATQFFGELGYVPHVVSGGKLQLLDQGLVGYEGPKENFVFRPA